MELASEIQRQILPKAVPEIAGYELAGWNRPARHIGGDYYDLFRVREAGSGSALVVGDVSGKGVPAALLVSTLHSALRLLLERMEVGPDAARATQPPHLRIERARTSSSPCSSASSIR